MVISEINITNRYLVEEFLASAGRSLNTFKYFERRKLSVLDNHIVTCIGVINSRVVAYRHLDRDKNKVWLGIAVIAECCGRGLGRKMMEHLLGCARDQEVSQIYLSVNRANNAARHLYEECEFVRIENNETDYYYQLALT